MGPLVGLRTAKPPNGAPSSRNRAAMHRGGSGQLDLAVLKVASGGRSCGQRAQLTAGMWPIGPMAPVCCAPGPAGAHRPPHTGQTAATTGEKRPFPPAAVVFAPGVPTRTASSKRWSQQDRRDQRAGYHTDVACSDGGSGPPSALAQDIRTYGRQACLVAARSIRWPQIDRAAGRSGRSSDTKVLVDPTPKEVRVLPCLWILGATALISAIQGPGALRSRAPRLDRS